MGSWWTRYWSAPGGRIAAAVVRIALAIAGLLLLDQIRELPAVRHPEQMAASIYHPVGILMLFRSPPPAIAIALAEAIAWAGALAMLIGFCTRAATVAAALGALVVASQAMSYQPSWFAYRAATVFVSLFVLLDLTISFTPGLDQALRTFPFSRFPMFAVIRAKQPYAEHLSYELIAGRIELVTDRPLEPWIQTEIDRDYAYRSLHRETDRDALRARTAVLLDEVRHRYPALAIRGVRVYVTMYQAPPYPAPARLGAHDLGILGELIDDTWTSHYLALPGTGRISLAVDPALVGATLALYRNGLPSMCPPLSPDTNTLQLPQGRGTLHLVARLAGPDGVVRPYLVARRTGRYW